MNPLPDLQRTKAYGQNYSPTWVDSFGTWLSWRKIKPYLNHKNGRKLRLGDFGCGYYAALTRHALPQISNAVVIDLQLCADLRNDSKVCAIEGSLPEALEVLDSESLDIIICNSVLEHLEQPHDTLLNFYRLLAPGGVCLINVPSWLGKEFLEFSAFRLGLSPVEEMNDHKIYYDPRDLWPLLVKVGFKPSRIHCAKHKFGLNTFAHCHKPETT